MDKIVGFTGSALVIFGYFPQVYHLIKEHCTAGLSRKAFIIWTAASVLFLIHAAIINDLIFEIVQGISLISSVIITIFCYKYKDQYCKYHFSLIKKRE